MKDDLQGWVEEARRGSKDAFCEIVRTYQAGVRAFLARYVRNRGVVDDLAQETFFAAFRGLEGYDGRTPLRAWLLGIARHRALMHFRQERRGSALAEWWARRIEADTAAGEERERELDALRGCVDGLPEKSAALIHEYYYQGAGAAELARRRSTSEGSIWVTILRLRKALRRCVETKLSGATS